MTVRAMRRGGCGRVQSSACGYASIRRAEELFRQTRWRTTERSPRQSDDAEDYNREAADDRPKHVIEPDSVQDRDVAGPQTVKALINTIEGRDQFPRRRIVSNRFRIRQKTEEERNAGD